MSNYVKTTNFTAKDSLASGDPNKVIRGSEFDTEFNNIATAVATKVEAADPTFTGTTTVNNLTVSGTFNGTIAGGTY
jgi:cytoskeletal protein CcmA (bactofilin family)